MKYFTGLTLIFTMVFAAADIYAACEPVTVKRTNSRGSTNLTRTGSVATARKRVNTSDISGHMRRLEDELEEIDEKLSRINPDGRTALNFRHKREITSLKLIQMIQLELLDMKPGSGKYKKMALLLFNEGNSLTATAEKIKDFPLAGKIVKFKEGLLDIRSGKEKFSGRIAKSDSALLKEIHKIQRQMLEEHHKQEQKNFKSK